MRILKKLLLVALIIAAAAFFLNGDIAGTGENKGDETSKEDISRAVERINKEGLDIFVNGVSCHDIKDQVRISKGLDILIPKDDITRLTGLTVYAGMNDTLVLSDRNGRRMEAGKTAYTMDGDLHEIKGIIVPTPEKTYVNFSKAAEEFNIDYKLNIKEGSLSVIYGKDPSGKEDLPSSYSMLDAGRLTEIRSQGNQSTCWAYAATAAVESVLMPDENMRFSEQHMIENSGFNITDSSGGDQVMALSYYASWKGPVLYGSGSAEKHIQEALKPAAKDYDAIKRCIYISGGVESSIYSDITRTGEDSDYYNDATRSYYYNGHNEPNHDIVIVGWDDDYPKENFYHAPEHDGAFLCRNSWGKAFGEEGYFYISYDDTNIGIYNTVYTSVDEPDNYDNIYQSDLLGFIGALGYEERFIWIANSYITENDETLKAVSFYTTDKDELYSIYITKDDLSSGNTVRKEFLVSGIIETPGYHTVTIPEEVELSYGESFSVVVRLETKEEGNQAAVEYNSSEITEGFDITDGEGYISSDGKSFENTEKAYKCNICLKAFTDNR